ncbi:methionine-rich copper-binding protein CopC [Brevundimonas sp. UYEF29]|jgi:methionine-rich copper-binding protein CopC|uniref:copper homeostasis periplasmic binding protein CopC n=1 Tax=Brevundimonas TaxID=41275 RepID=UPI0011F9FF00|nr:copper homeostasis periplasmic binding protein CopC [uncultured Brevundimonas sp.]RZJ46966.1 MAG: copper resistance protein CopC [Brevundimonas sp.]
MFRPPFAVAALSAAILAVSAVAAEAHARLVRSDPAADAVVAAPRTISLTFSDRVAPAFSGFDLVNAGGDRIAVRTQVSEDGKTVSGAPARALAPGAYTINWRIAASDGHRMTGSVAFTVR